MSWCSECEQDKIERTNAVLAKIRHKQLVTARAGRIRESMHYARLASRVRRVIQNWTASDDSGPCSAAG